LKARPSLSATSKTILLSHSATTIVRFLDIASVSSPTFSTGYDETVELLDFVDYLKPHALVPRVKTHLYQVMSRECRAADLLLVASSKDDWKMGQIAIQNLSAAQASQLRRQPGGFQGFFDKLRPVLRRTLIDLIFFAAYQPSSTTTSKLFWDWSSLDSKFVAPEKTEAKRKSE
jgi:hypothetical protein